MDDDDIRALAASLFAFATGLMEDAHEVATCGQSAGLDPGELRVQSDRLNKIVQDATAIATAITVVTKISKQ